MPVSSSKNPFLKRISRGLSKRDVKYILFERDLLDEDEDGDKADKYPFNVYSRISKNGGTAATLAHFFDAKPGSIKGKKLYGDERYLLNILRKDSVAFVYTGLDNVYDMRTRQLKSGLSLVSLNVRSKQKERLYSGDVDHVLNLLENEPVEQIPVVRFGFAAGQDSRREVADFIRWVLERGQQYNHALGFLELDQQTLETQKSRVGEAFVSYRDR